MILDGVDAASASNAWAVGTYNTDTSQKTITVRWNGRTWKQVPNPSPGPEPSLSGVAAASASAAWAVGATKTAIGQPTIIAHWNGTAWKQEASPSPGTGSSLTGVTATSVGNVWAVGDFSNGGPSQVFAIHCC